ncbi:hypothetical protein ACFOW1_15295 [Parasediminibacterium paludis]|uniref:Cytochrome b562 n=1 Tax=Parasediminibacterium paludis TaxID=908966 RepID=A0ABV8Q1Z4_9BACT
MKFLKMSLLPAFAVFVSSSVSAQFKLAQWPALQTFHGVMSETFHPSEEGKLEPIKARSTEMYEKAVALSKSAIPDALKAKKGIKEAVAELVKGTKVLDALVKAKVSDEVIKTKLASLHDTFHKIIETCNKEDDEKH